MLKKILFPFIWSMLLFSGTVFAQDWQTVFDSDDVQIYWDRDSMQYDSEKGTISFKLKQDLSQKVLNAIAQNEQERDLVKNISCKLNNEVYTINDETIYTNQYQFLDKDNNVLYTHTKPSKKIFVKDSILYSYTIYYVLQYFRATQADW